MSLRQPFRAGSFYEADETACRVEAKRLISAASLPDNLPAGMVGGIAPHAGWLYSGAVAATTLVALASQHTPDTVVLFGADHFGTAAGGEVFNCGAWATPLGELPIDEALAAACVAADERLTANCAAHVREHSLEVLAPLIQELWPDVRIVPILVVPESDAVAVGEVVGGVLAEWAGDMVVVGSTDLTHHGGQFGNPGGRGSQGVDWAVDNDRRMIDLIEAMAAADTVAEARQRGNACGAGAIAATIAACRRLGATAGRCLDYTNSYEVMQTLYASHGDDTTVGYASVVFA
jgi:MEMO1 family protein